MAESKKPIDIVAETIKPIKDLLKKRLTRKVDALKAYDTPINEADAEIKRIREIEAVKLRHEIEVLNDLIATVDAMYP